MFKNRLGFIVAGLLVSICWLYTSAAFYNFEINSSGNQHFFNVNDSIKANSSTNFCDGQNVILEKFNNVTGLYQWRKDNQPISGATQRTLQAIESGVYSLQITRGATITYSNDITVIENAAPVANFSFISDLTCLRPNAIFTNLSTGNGLSYQWDFGDLNSGANNTSTLPNPTHEFIGNVGTGIENITVKLTVTNAEGCTAIHQKTIQVKRRPSTNLNGPGKKTYNGDQFFTICTNATSPEFEFSNASTTGSTNTNYRIVWGDGSPEFSSSTFTTLRRTFNIGLHEFKFMVTDAGGCIDTAEYKVYVGNTPSIGLGTPGNTNICYGDSLTFQISNTASNPPGTTYTINYGDGIVERFTQANVPTSVTHVFNKTSCGVTSNNGPITFNNAFAVSIEASNPCSSSAAVVVPINVSEKPDAVINFAGSTTFCVNTTKTFSNASTGLKQVSGNVACSDANSIWEILDEAGVKANQSTYTVSSGTIGTDNGSTNSASWIPGSANIAVRFLVSGKYKIRLRVGSDCGDDVIDKEICVTPTPVATFDLDKTSGCGPLIVNADNTSADPLCGANTYQWSVTYSNPSCGSFTSGATYTNGTSSSSKNPQFTLPNPGTYTIRLIVLSPDGTCSSTQVSKTVTVKAKPIATINIPNPFPSSVCVNGSVSPEATVSNCYSTTPETYLWEVTGGTVANPTTKVPGAITFNTAGLQTIKLTVTNECGATVTTKDITVTDLPEVTVPTDLTSCPGVMSGPLPFTSATSGVTYTWTNDRPAIGLVANGTGQITSFNLTNTTGSTLTATITVTPRVGNCTGISKQFKIIVDPSPPGPAVISPVQYCVGETATPLSATASAGFSLKWYTLSSGGTASTTAPIPPTTTATTRTYYVSQISSSGCESLRIPITVTINPVATAPAATSTYNLCLGSNSPALTATASANNTLIWYTATNDTLTGAPIPNTSSLGTVKYFVSQRSTAGCESPKREITVNVVDLPGSPTANQTITYCFGATPARLSATTNSGNTLRWYASASGGTPMATAPSPNTNVADTVTYYVSQITANNCESPRLPIDVIVLPSVGITSNLNAVSTCNEEQFSYQITASQAGATITWARPSVAGLQNTAATGNTQIAEQLINTSSNPIVVIYTITATANGCSVVREKRVTVNPTLSLSSSQSTNPICSGATFSYSPASNTPGATFTWSRTVVAGISNSASSGSGAISEALVNTTNAPIEVTYLVTPVLSGCQGAVNTIKVMVNPGVTFTSPLSVPAICSGSVFTYGPSSNIPGAIMTWTRTAVAGISNPAGSGSDTIAETLINNTTRPIIVNYRYQIEANNCIIFRDVPITVNPQPKAEFSAQNTVGCSPFNISSVVRLVPHTDANSNYEWFADGVSIGTGQTVPAISLTGNNKTLTLKLVASSKFGCGVDSMSTVFNTSAGLVPGFAMTDNEGCGPLSVNFSNTTNDLPGNTYAWDFGNGRTLNTKNPGTIIYAAHPQNRDSTYYVSLTISSSCSTIKLIDSVKVLAAPIAVLSPSATVGCSPMKVDFTNHSKGTNSYTIDFGDGTSMVRSSLERFSHTYNTTKKDTFTVILTATNGCGNNISSYDIIVSPNSIVPELVVSGGSKFGCAPFTVDFDNNSIGANKFDWDFGDGTQESGTIAPERRTHTFTQPGRYVVALRASNGCSDSTTTETITVYPAIISSISTLKGEFCPFEIVQFNSTTLSDVSWLWDFGDGNTSTLQNPAHSFASPGIKNVRLTITQSFSDGTQCSRTLSKQLRVIAKPEPGFSSNENLLNCAPFNYTVNATPANSSNVEWNFGDPGSPDNLKIGHTAVHTYKKPGLYTVTQIVYNLTGCTDTLRQNVRITESPEVSFSIPDTTVCGNSTLLDLINTTTYGGTDRVSYSWFINGVQVSTVKDYKAAYVVPAGTALPYQLNIKLVANSTIGCERSITRTIQFNPLPKAAFTTKVNAACAPYTLEIANQSTFTDQYKWYLDGVLVSQEKIPQNLSLTGDGKSFKLKLVASSEFGCFVDSLEQTVTTYPKPEAIFSLQDSVSCNGILDLKISNLSIGANSYNWSFGDGSPDQTAAVPNYAYGKPGVYNLRLITSNGFCTDTLTKQIRIAGLIKTAFIPSQTEGCSLITVTFQNLSTNADSYLWDFGDGTFSTSKNPTHNFNFTKSPYTVKLIGYGEFGCTDTTVVVNQIRVSAPPKADFDVLPDSVIKIPDFTFNFKSTSGDSIKHSWNFGDGKRSTLQDPSHTYADTGKYVVTLIAENLEGCKDTIQRTVQVAGVPGHLYVPNAFEPASGKQSLKIFKPLGSGILAYRMQVFDKWGRMLWESSQIDSEGSPVEGWDGTFNGEPMPQGVYIWKIESKFINGTDWKGMVYKNSTLPHKTGSIHLIR